MEYQMSERHACRLMGLGRSTHRYRARRERDAALRMRLKELAARRMRFGYRRLTAMLLREGMPANHKRVYRLYREEGLAMRIRKRRRIRWSGAVVKPAASQPNQRWSMDFVTDCVSSGKVIRMLTIVDDCTRGFHLYVQRRTGRKPRNHATAEGRDSQTSRATKRCGENRWLAGHDD